MVNTYKHLYPWCERCSEKKAMFIFTGNSTSSIFDDWFVLEVHRGKPAAKVSVIYYNSITNYHHGSVAI